MSYAYRYPYRARRVSGWQGPLAGAAVLAVLLAAPAARAGHVTAARHGGAGGGTGPAAEAIAYARAQLGRPYQWGGTGPDAFDCSGLVQAAYASAGVHLARTSQDQWRTERHVTVPRPGDLAFFAGADGTMTAPGHVGLVIGGGRMIEAYATGYPIRVSGYERPDFVGFTDPRGGA